MQAVNMEAAPPTYEAATLTNHWDLVANYLPLHDLSSCALVCSRWHTTFSPYIWGNPSSHFGADGDAVHTSLTRFQRALRSVRLHVRELTHTLHFSAIDADLYDSPDEHWLGDVLGSLPNLQSLIVRGLSFFDHGALQVLSLDRSKAKEARRSGTELPVSIANAPFGLRLLDASGCDNATSHGLATALRRFEILIYLDLSFTAGARNSAVMAAVGDFTGLQVLKLRGIRLHDGALILLCKLIRLRIRSLDIRDNEITDRGVNELLLLSFLDGSALARQRQSAPAATSKYQGEGLESYFRKAFTSNFVNRLAIEDAPAVGLTHLYISGNRITVDGVHALLRTEILLVLDAGSIQLDIERSSFMSGQGVRSGMHRSGIEKLITALKEDASGALTYLRVDHRLVTHGTDRKNESVEGLDETLVSFDALQLNATPGGGQVDRRMDTSQQEPPRYEANDGIAEPAPGYDIIYTAAADDSVESSKGQEHSRVEEVHPSTMQTQYLAISPPVSFQPAMLPRLETLVLTDFPPFSSDRTLANRIIGFIESCAQEAAFARRRPAVDYDVAPYRKGPAPTLQASARKAFALRRIVLELAPTRLQHEMDVMTSSPGRHAQDTKYKSMTEDQDSETFWSASEKDFSFFSNDEDSTASTSNTVAPASSPHGPTLEKAVVDNIALISAFRKERKLAAQRSVEAGEVDAEIEGLWDGIVSVVRDTGSARRDEESDYYGTRRRVD
ncbi:leucine rich repeat domain-containing protein [Zymoseptoria brevis]|uniref:Leucine rich repeat domain-containing protein n=1 Tax=Zymoseptoria brevis TaxID=1047168 RepID=A0A0F4GWX3_9PEZI|nr:leucine rich repeat domain-containing protein [Zymoseptoria brevis]